MSYLAIIPVNEIHKHYCEMFFRKIILEKDTTFMKPSILDGEIKMCPTIFQSKDNLSQF